MSTYASLIRQIRRRMGDRPERVFVQDNPLTAGAALMTILAADVGKFPNSSIFLNFDDGTDELVITTAPADTATNTIAIARGQDGTTGASHAQNAAALFRPRHSNAEIIDVVDYLIGDELWPQVWTPAETTLAFQSVNDYFSPTPTDIGEIAYAYQLSGGQVAELHAEFIPPNLADNTNFPRGAVLIRRTVDSSTIYLAYRAKPTLATLGDLEKLGVLGCIADLTMREEAEHVGPAATAVDHRVSDGSKLRAGAVLWDRFNSSRMQKYISLQHEEAKRRTTFLRAGHA